MKNKLFTTIVVLVSLALAVLWIREQNYRSRLRHIDSELAAMQIRVRILYLKTQALKAEVELLNLSTYIKLLKGWKPELKPRGNSNKRMPQKHKEAKRSNRRGVVSLWINNIRRQQ